MTSALATRYRCREFVAPLIVSAVLAGCADLADAPPSESRPETPRVLAVPFQSLPGWNADRHGEALEAFIKSCAKLSSVSKPFRSTDLAFTVAPTDWRKSCAVAKTIPRRDDSAARRFFEEQFQALAVVSGDKSRGLFTGYYEPELPGDRRPSARFRYPIYRKPPELVSVDLGRFRAHLKGERIAGRVEDGRLIPYAERAGIDAGALKGRALELFWLADPVDSFFLHVQGSGRVALPGGRRVRVGYAGQNGHVYSSIGRELVRRGELRLEEASMQSIRRWVQEHPREADSLLAVNRSYVFFREISGDGPIGSQGVVLTPGRSIAVDRRHYPLGIPVWLDLPEDAVLGGAIRRLMIAQDTGGAIKGLVRGDFFWGSGDAAGQNAGRMKARGSWSILLPRAAAARLAPTS